MKTKQKKIDNNDKKILSIIARDARVPLKDVAKVCNMSRAAVHQRVLRMIEGGVITGSRYDVSPQCVGYSTCTYVGIKLERGSMYKEVACELEKIQEIVECHFTTGPYTMLIKLYSRDNEHLMDLLNNHIQEIPGVVSTETLISLEQSFSRQIPVVLPMEDEDSGSRKMKALIERMNAAGVIVDDPEESIETLQSKKVTKKGLCRRSPFHRKRFLERHSGHCRLFVVLDHP